MHCVTLLALLGFQDAFQAPSGNNALGTPSDIKYIKCQACETAVAAAHEQYAAMAKSKKAPPSEEAAQQLPDLGGLGWSAERSEEAPAAWPEPAEDAERLSFAMVLFAGIGALVTLAGSFFGAVWLPGRRTVLL